MDSQGESTVVGDLEAALCHLMNHGSPSRVASTRVGHDAQVTGSTSIPDTGYTVLGGQSRHLRVVPPGNPGRKCPGAKGGSPRSAARLKPAADTNLRPTCSFQSA